MFQVPNPVNQEFSLAETALKHTFSTNRNGVYTNVDSVPSFMTSAGIPSLSVAPLIVSVVCYIMYYVITT